MCPVVSAEKENNIFFKSRCKNLLFNFESTLTLKGPGFSGEGMGWNLLSSITLLFKDQ